jgi:hypothetical protein
MTTQSISFSSVISRDVFQSGSLSDQSCIDLEAYFVAVKTRYEFGEEYPYDLEELVPTVFAQKVKAIEALQKEFTQDIDYCLFSREGKNPQGGRPSITYHLSPLAFEFMVARKSKDVFSLYHRVFHAKTQPLSPAEQLLLSAQQLVAHERRLQMTEQRQDKLEVAVAEIKATLPSAHTHSTVKAYAISREIIINKVVALKLGRRCALRCKSVGLPLLKISDDQYGVVNAYPLEILQQVFDEEMAILMDDLPGRVPSAH